MLIVIGKVGCSKCIELKDNLTKQGKEFTYVVLEDMDRVARRLYTTMVRNENDGHLPLVLGENGEVIKEDNNDIR